MLHGFDCMACGFNFGEFYGVAGKGLIEVHHVVPLSEAGPTETNPETDLIVLCANYHWVVHWRRGTCLSLDELKGTELTRPLLGLKARGFDHP